MERKEQTMNSCNFIGRLTRDPEVRYSQGEKPVCVARFTLAVDRPTKRGNEREADFLTFKALGGRGELAGGYMEQPEEYEGLPFN